MDNPAENVERILIHRQERENKVVAALKKAGQPANIESLVKLAYNDTPERLHVVAQKSLLAHLEKLRKEARAVLNGDLWSLSATA